MRSEIERCRIYRAKNRDDINARRRQAYLLNREKVLARQKAYRDANPDVIRRARAREAKKEAARWAPIPVSVNGWGYRVRTEKSPDRVAHRGSALSHS